MPTANAIRAAALALALLSSMTASAVATDYHNVCQTAAGDYEINDGALLRTGGTNAASIPFETLVETVLEAEDGYCHARGKRYEHEYKTSIQRIRFTADGQTVERDTLCVYATDGLPAAYKCERKAKTKSYKWTADTKPKTSSGAPPVWVHNNSVMRMSADGANLTFAYEIPREGMQAVGARSGDIVVEGSRQDGKFAGTAYITTEACGRVGYRVEGRMSSDGQQLVVEGQVPRLGVSCKPRSTRRDRLQFDLVAR